MISSYPEILTAYPPINDAPYGVNIIRRFGLHATVGTTQTMVDDVGAAVPYMPTTAVTIEALSSSANDTSSGTGARTVMVSGIDQNWEAVTQFVSMNGVTPVTVSGQWLRVTKAEVVESGTYGPVAGVGSNIGTITVRVASGGTTFVMIGIGNGQTFSSHFCVPIAKYAHISGADLSTESTKNITLTVYARDSANDIVAPYGATQVVKRYIGVTGITHFDYSPSIEISQCTDVWLTANTTTGTAAVCAEYWGWYK